PLLTALIRSLVRSAAKCQHRQEYKWNKKQSCRISPSFAKRFCQLDPCKDQEYNIPQREKSQQEKPAIPPCDLCQNICIVKWYDCRPARLSGFLKQFPLCNDHNDAYCKDDQYKHQYKYYCYSYSCHTLFPLHPTVS